MVDNILGLVGRTNPLFENDITKIEGELQDIISNSRFLVVGGAGTIGSAICRELFARNPKVLHVVDISENNMVELVRDIRSSVGYGTGEFATFAIDCGSDIFESFIDAQVKRIGGYDYIFNTSALKHVRSEKDPFTLMRMVDTNVFYTDKVMQMAEKMGAKKYFCVSTDKAANPVNMMGASKRIMEMFLNRRSENMPLAMARFANVAFSDGSLLYGFNRRIDKNQPLSAPCDVRRYFVTPKESGQLCHVLPATTGISISLSLARSLTSLHSAASLRNILLISDMSLFSVQLSRKQETECLSLKQSVSGRFISLTVTQLVRRTSRSSIQTMKFWT